MFVLTLTAMSLAFGQPQSQKNDARPEPAKPHKICRSQVATGSIMSTRICHTAEEWAAVDAANGESSKTMLDQARHSASQTH